MATPHLPRQRLSAAERRAAIVDSAVSLFAERGFRGTTTREIAAAVGVTEPVLYQHFATKRAMYDAILEANAQDQDPTLQERLAELSAAGDNRALFMTLGELMLGFHIRDPRFARLLMFSALERHELSKLFFEKKVACFYEFITAHIERQIAIGAFRPVNLLLAARAFAGMIAHHGLLFSVMQLGGLPASPAEIIESVVDIFLGGITA